MVSQDKAVQYVGAYPGFMICLDASADDMTWNLDKEFRPALQWQLASTPGNTIVKLVWETYYEFILNANLVLKYVEIGRASCRERVASPV